MLELILKISWALTQSNAYLVNFIVEKSGNYQISIRSKEPKKLNIWFSLPFYCHAWHASSNLFLLYILLFNWFYNFIIINIGKRKYKLVSLVNLGSLSCICALNLFFLNFYYGKNVNTHTNQSLVNVHEPFTQNQWWATQDFPSPFIFLRSFKADLRPHVLSPVKFSMWTSGWYFFHFLTYAINIPTKMNCISISPNALSICKFPWCPKDVFLQLVCSVQDAVKGRHTLYLVVPLKPFPLSQLLFLVPMSLWEKPGRVSNGMFNIWVWCFFDTAWTHSSMPIFTWLELGAPSLLFESLSSLGFSPGFPPSPLLFLLRLPREFSSPSPTDLLLPALSPL